ncbi:MAG: hypothetical protein ACTSUE_00090 [Promethearchaeota archaeon]
MDVDDYLNLGIMLLFCVLLILFVNQIVRKKRSVPFFVASLAAGAGGGLFAFLDSLRDDVSVPLDHTFMLAMQISLYGIQFFFFYMFLESLVAIKVHPLRLAVVLVLLTLQIMSLWLIVLFQASPVTNDLWLLADMGYANLALFTFVVFGMYIYVKMYQYTREWKPLVFSFALLIVGSGFIIISILDYTSYWSTVPGWLSDISILGDILPLTGLAMFTIVYLSNVDYIYRLPFDVYSLVVSTNDGVSVYAVSIENTKNIKVEDQLLSGLITAINQLFGSILQTNTTVRNVISDDASILIQRGEFIDVIIVASSNSAILERALKRYVKEFSMQFSHRFSLNSMVDTEMFADAKRLIKPVFPFFKLQDG